MYNCEYCNYNTNNKSGLTQHNKTKKHLNNTKNVEKKEITENQNKEITENQNKEITENQNKELKEEQEKVNDIPIIENQNKEQKSDKLPIIKNQNKELDEQKKKLIKDKKIAKLKKREKLYKNLSDKAKIINNEINLIDDIQIDKLMDNIIASYNTEALYKIIGDHIINIYNEKKESIRNNANNNVTTVT